MKKIVLSLVLFLIMMSCSILVMVKYNFVFDGIYFIAYLVLVFFAGWGTADMGIEISKRLIK